GRLPRARVEEANARLDVLAQRFFHPPEDRLHTLGTKEHLALAQDLSSTFRGKDPTEPHA
ncbi:MAG: beta-N-acetylhexosaminidase, partial [Myxococcota bacterium]